MWPVNAANRFVAQAMRIISYPGRDTRLIWAMGLRAVAETPPDYDC
jgi:hypothetical protein